MTTSVVLIEFESKKDAARGLDLLLDEGESYSGIPEGIFISSRMVQRFKKESIKFREVSKVKKNPIIALLSALRPSASKEAVKKKRHAA